MRRRRALFYLMAVLAVSFAFTLLQSRNKMPIKKPSIGDFMSEIDGLKRMNYYGPEPPLVQALLKLDPQTQTPMFQSMEPPSGSDPLLVSPSIVTDYPNKRIAIVTMYFGSAAELKPFTRANKLSYAEHHGYAFIDASEDPVLMKAWQTDEVKRNILQSKFFVLQHYMSTGKYDWLFWTDSDAVFLNRSRSLKDAGAVDYRFDMVVPVGSAFDFHWGKIVNTGHFSVRASPWGRRLVERAWSIRPGPGARCPAEPHGLLNRWLSVCSGEGNGVSYWLGDQVR